MYKYLSQNSIEYSFSVIKIVILKIIVLKNGFTKIKIDVVLDLVFIILQLFKKNVINVLITLKLKSLIASI